MAELRAVDDGLLLILDADEVALLDTLAASLLTRVSTGSWDPHDAILARFAPSASRGDAEVARELRGMLVDELMETRRARLAALRADLTTWSSGSGPGIAHRLDREEAERLIEVINDLRLALGASVGVESIERADLDPEDPRAGTLGLMDHLGWMQGRLIEFVEP
jgi:hypothetical protein